MEERYIYIYILTRPLCFFLFFFWRLSAVAELAGYDLMLDKEMLSGLNSKTLDTYSKNVNTNINITFN